MGRRHYYSGHEKEKPNDTELNVRKQKNGKTKHIFKQGKTWAYWPFSDRTAGLQLVEKQENR